MKDEVPGECSNCHKTTEKGKIGLCKTCFKRKYNIEASSAGANY